MTAPRFITWASMMDCVGRGTHPNFMRVIRLRMSFSCMTLMLLDLMSTPTRFFPSAIGIEFFHSGSGPVKQSHDGLSGMRYAKEPMSHVRVLVFGLFVTVSALPSLGRADVKHV